MENNNVVIINNLAASDINAHRVKGGYTSVTSQSALLSP